jgi:hypothetical protein
MKRQWSNECLVLPWYFRRHAGANAREEEPDRSGLWRASERERETEGQSRVLCSCVVRHQHMHKCTTLPVYKVNAQE